MLIDHALMRRWGFLLLLALAFGCTKPNPLSCADGTCTDPGFPFCDVDGALDGTVGACIAVACEPATFDSCRGDLVITCNTEGTDFDLIQCERGCEDGIGCRLCDPNETACTNGTVATCDAAGAVVDSQSCPLGCFEDEPRCRELEPSNGLAQFMDLVADPPDVVLETNSRIDTDTGTVTVNGSPLDVPNFVLSAPSGGSSVRVFVVRLLRAENMDVIGARALAIVASSDITLEGRFQLTRGMGAFNAPGCTGGSGRFTSADPGDPPSAIGGGAGGGFATAGGAGGAVIDHVLGGTPGSVSGNPELVPLRGGCWGGGHKLQGDGGQDFTPVGPGGGAVQLVSQTRIDVLSAIDADGSTEDCQQITNDGSGCFGGGAGGGILLEAPVVSLGNQAALLARGGPGGGGAIPPEVDSMLPISGGQLGSDGAAPGFIAEAGMNVTYSNTFATNAAGGGGGLGRIRINTGDGTFNQASSTILAGSITAGVATTR